MHDWRVTGARFLSTAVLLAVFGSPLVAADGKSRFYHMLIARREEVRLQALGVLQKNDAKRDQLFDDLNLAVKTLAEEAVKDDAPNKGLPRSTVEAIHLLAGSPNPQAVETLIDLLDSSCVEISMTSADALGENDCREALPKIIAQVERPDFETIYAYRHCLLAAIARIHDPKGLEYLIDTLPTLEGQLAHEVYQFLDEVTAQHFGNDHDKYKKWLREVWQPAKDGMNSPPQDETVPTSLARYQKRPRYYGFEIYADRLVFVIDLSESMNKGVGGVSRLERAKNELRQAIMSLPDDTEFAIVTFAGDIHTWHPELVRATDENKLAAIEFIYKMRGNGWTNTYGAMTQSLVLDPNTEAIYLLSDGEPTVGAITQPAAIVDNVTWLNTFRRVTINSIGVAINGPTERFMQALATENGGQYRAAN